MSEISKIIADGAKRIGKSLGQDAGQAIKKLYHQTGDNLDTVVKNHVENDAKHADHLRGLGRKEHHEHAPESPHQGGGSAAPGRRGGPSARTPAGSQKPKLDGIGPAKNQVGDGHAAGRGPDSVCAGGEPVDMATGRMFIDETDVELAGVLPLLFTRSHESGYQAGRWMGPRWVCTFDERLELDEESAVYLATDRLAQLYPRPVEGEPPVFPGSGVQTELRAVSRDGRRLLTLTDRQSGLVREFTPIDGTSTAPLTRITDRSGRSLEFGYDEDGFPTEIVHSGGYRLRVTVEQGRITALRLADADGGGHEALLVRYGYTDGHLSAVYNSSGRAVRFTNDARGRIVSWTDRVGTEYRYTYDESDRVTREGGSDGTLDFRYTYGDPDPRTGLRTHTETNALGHTTTYQVNRFAQITAETDPLGNTTRYEWDEHHRLLSVTDPAPASASASGSGGAGGRTTRYEYDGAGDLVRVVRPDGAEARLVYGDRPGQPIEVTEPGGAVWRQTLDEAGRRTALTDPTGATTRYRYDERGDLSAVTDALGGTTTIRRNPAGLPLEVTDPLGATTRYQRDAYGRVTAITDPLGAVTTLTWTPEGRRASRTDPDGATERWEYDAEGNLLRHTDRLGRITTNEYGPFRTLTASTGPDGVRYTFDHDADLNLVSVTNALGQTWDYRYDAAGRLIGESDFHGRTTEYRLDADGQLAVRRNALGQEVRYRYDELGRVVAKEADGRTTEYSYDPAGNLLRVADGSTEVLRTVDARGGLLTETVDGRTLRNRLDPLGRRLSRTTPGGHTSTWTYDAAGRRTALSTTGGELTFGYDAAGREQLRTVGGRVVLRSRWDELDRLAEQELTAGGEPLQRRDYRYREDGRLLAVADLLSGRREFERDRADRVTSVSAEGWRERYAYDAAGNLTGAEWPATEGTQDAQGAREFTDHRLSGAGRVRYEQDAAGRITLRQVTRLSRKPDTWRYTWDSEDRLTGVTTPDGTRWRYRYDPFGRRIAKERLAAEGETVTERTDFSWDGAVLVEQTTYAPYLPGSHTLSWDHQGLQPVCQTETITSARTSMAGATGVAAATGATGAAEGDGTGGDDDRQESVDRRFFAIVTDLVGSPTELVDPETGSIAWRASTSLWGIASWPSSSSTYTPLRFPGQYFDPETRLHYNLARYYDPETARYTSPDPLGLDAAPNAEAYVDDPLTMCDPLGLVCTVYRSLRPDEDPALGLTAKDPQATYSLTTHVLKGSKKGFKSQYISTTRRLAVIDKWKPKTGARVVRIDLDKFRAEGGKVYDLSSKEGRAAAPGKNGDLNPPFPEKGFARNWAHSSQEVVLLGRVPPEAITWVEGGPAAP